MSMQQIKYILCSPIVIFMGILILLFGGTSALGIVWLRAQINQTAGIIKKQEHEYSQVERKIRETNSKIAIMHQPYNLKKALDPSFEPIKAQQVFVVHEREDGSMVAKRMVQQQGSSSSNVVLVGGRQR